MWVYLNIKTKRKTCRVWPLGQALKTDPAPAYRQALGNLCCCSVRELTVSVCSFQRAELLPRANPRGPLLLFPLCFFYLSAHGPVSVRWAGQILITSQDVLLPRGHLHLPLLSPSYQATLCYRQYPTRPCFWDRTVFCLVMGVLAASQ